MVGENRLGKLVLQMPTEKELLTQRSLRSERHTGDLFLVGKRLLTPRPLRTEGRKGGGPAFAGHAHAWILDV
jgi:hypothetical protein